MFGSLLFNMFLCDLFLIMENIDIASYADANTTCKCYADVNTRLDSKLIFYSHILNICEKTGETLNAISRKTPYMDFAKRRFLVNTFFYSQVNYFQLVWMCHNQTNNSKINRLHDDVFV